MPSKDDQNQAGGCLLLYDVQAVGDNQDENTQLQDRPHCVSLFARVLDHPVLILTMWRAKELIHVHAA